MTHAVDSLFQSYSPEWKQRFEKHTILAYLYRLSNTMTTNHYINEPRLSFIYLESDALLFVT